MLNFVDIVAKQICLIYQIFQIVRLLSELERYRLFVSFSQTKACRSSSHWQRQEQVATVFCARRIQPRRQKHLLTWRNRGGLVSGALSQEVRSWSALCSAGDVNKVYRNYDGRFRLHEEIV